MTTPASIHKHPIHPMLVPFPIALWIFSLFCDVVYGMGWGASIWKDMAFYTMIGGIGGALLAAIQGLIDYRSLTDTQVKRVAWWHMNINLCTVVLFSLNAWLRTGGQAGSHLAIFLSVVGIALLGVSGWLGGELVYVHGVAVEGDETSRGAKREEHQAAHF